MSTVITTDVFCDAPDGTGTCPQRVHGVTSHAVDRPSARRQAAYAGWVHHKGHDYCPTHTHLAPPVNATAAPAPTTTPPAEAC